MFNSFFLAGFECTTGFNKDNRWIDQVYATQHDRFIDEDYGLVAEVGISAVREGVRWPVVDRNGQYDFSSLHRSMERLIKITYKSFMICFILDIHLTSILSLKILSIVLKTIVLLQPNK